MDIFLIDQSNEFSFPEWFSKEERKLIHDVAEDRGLSHHFSLLEGEERYITIAKKREMEHTYSK